jgi:hypothetical protein
MSNTGEGLLLFKKPIEKDWAFKLYIGWTLINSFSSYKQYYSGSNIAAFGGIAAAVDLAIFPLLGTYVMMLVILIPRYFIQKSNLQNSNTKVDLDEKLEFGQIKETKFQDINLGNPKIFAVGVLVILLLLDFGIRTYEISKFLNAVGRSEKIMLDSIDKQNDIASKYWDRTLKHWNNPDLVDQLTASNALEASPKLASVKTQISRLSIMPWHKKINFARADYLDHQQAWIDQYTYESNGYDEQLTSPEIGSKISNTFSVFCDSAPNAVPYLDLIGAQAKITEFCKH